MVQDETISHLDATLKNNSEKPKRNTYVKFKLDNSDVWQEAKVLSRQPKQTGQYRDWLNVHVTGAELPMCVNWDDVESWSNLPCPENVVLMSCDEEMSQEVVDAKQVELTNLIDNHVFESVPFVNQAVVSSRWIITEKFLSGKKKVKARLVARGFEEDSSNFRKDSPTCSREGLRLVLLAAVTFSWELQSIDITAAFLQGDPLERVIYLRPPADVCPKNIVWRLKRCIYGLNDAPRSWYDRVRQVLLELGATVSTYDNALFLWHEKGDGTLMGVLVSHVDDFAFCGNDKFQVEAIEELKRTF